MITESVSLREKSGIDGTCATHVADVAKLVARDHRRHRVVDVGAPVLDGLRRCASDTDASESATANKPGTAATSLIGREKINLTATKPPFVTSKQ